MKVFLISNMYPSKNDGLFGVFVKNFKEEFESQGIKFSAKSVIKGKSYSAPKKLVRYLIHYLSILKNFIFCRYDFIYLHYLTHHLPILLVLLPFKSKPWVINAHGNDFSYLERKKFYKNIAAIILKRIELVVVPSSYLKNEILKNYPFLSGKDIFVSPSGGIDPALFYEEKNKPKNSTLNLGFVSRLIEEKGWKTFLNALVMLQNEGIPFTATIAGKGPDEEKIKTFITENDLFNVDFIGFVKQNELVHLYNQFDIYIFPTYHDSLGLTGVEAMACGTPVIASNIEGPSTYVQHAVNGFLFQCKNSQALFECISSFLKMNASSQEAMRQEALKHAQNYKKDLVAKRLITRLNILVNRK